MFGYVFTFLMIANCQPAPLVLKGGSIIWADCGWQRIGDEIVLRYQDFNFKMKAHQINWEATHLKRLGKKLHQKAQLKSEEETWADFVRQAKPKAKKSSSTLSQEKAVQDAKPFPSNTERKTQSLSKLIKKIEHQILQMTKRREQLRLQLHEDITWKQATYLLDQVDDLEQRIREKQYWLQRWKAAKKKNACHLIPKKTGEAIGLKAMTSKLTCATLISCYTEINIGVNHGQFNRHHRGSCA